MEPHDFDDLIDFDGFDADDPAFALDPEDVAVVEMSPDSLGGSSTVRSRDQALDSGLPLLMLHWERNGWRHIRAALDELHRTNAASLSLGTVINLPRVKPEAARAWLTTRAAASLRIADPELYTRDDMWGPRLLSERELPPKDGEPPKRLMPKTAEEWGFWTRPLPAGPDAAWVTEVLDAQRGAGANLLLSPGVPLDPHNPDVALTGLEQQVAWARAGIAPSERLAVNLTIDGAWLATPALRTRLLNWIVEVDLDTWYMRVKWPQQPSYAQLVDGVLLDAYRELAALMQDEERALLLPNSGGTGWVSLGWGATGFGTGLGNAARGFTTGKVIRMKKRPEPVPRYFERSLLHTVEKNTADRLARIPGYSTCTCRYCAELRTRPTWDPQLSAAHYVLTVGEMTAALAGPDRRGVARRIVRRAEKKAGSVSVTVPLTERDAPTHLPLWRARLV
ncbi:MAG: hypothetical protein JWO67_2587 [Streptosporangiaceae bacterium]|nr:hypothetical protein [Streptosporangiaceae bacterium]